MRKIKDVLRLKLDARLSHEQIAAALKISKGAVAKYAGLASAAGLDWAAISELDEAQLERRLLSKPRTVFTIGDRRFFMNYGDGVYYFSPENLKQYLEGLSFTIYYKDGTQKLVSEDNIQWQQVSGEWYPFVDGYPLGLMGELLMSYDPITQACESQGLVEYMGAAVTYTIYLVDPPAGSPETADSGHNLPLLLLPITAVALVVLLTKRRRLLAS